MTDPVLIDISVLVKVGTPEWPGDAAYACGWTALISAGASVNLSSVSGSPHVGTHADAPLHVRDDGAASDRLPLDAFVGRAIVVDYAVTDAAHDAGVERALAVGATRILMRTGHTVADGIFPLTWPALPLAMAQRLARHGVVLVGVDAPSVDLRDSTALPVHHALFAGGCHILENLDLRHVAPGPYDLLALPQRLAGLDAAPVRAVLRPAL
ncbi:MAG: cyclase family protein [Gemmatimonadaceae bacterium]